MRRISSHRGDVAFKLFYPLAFLGAHLSFMPLLLLLLPRRVEAIAEANSAVPLSLLLLIGGIAASVAHLAAGRWSDAWMHRHGSRRVPVAVGLIALVASYAGLSTAMSMEALLVAVVIFQIALNLMFAPLGALLTDYVDDGHKARTSAWLALALPLSIGASGLIASLWPSDTNEAFWGAAAAVAVCVVPLLLCWPHVDAAGSPRPRSPSSDAHLAFRDFWLAWFSRLFVQCGAALVINYLYIYLAQLPATSGRPVPVSEASATLLVYGSLAGTFATIAIGHISDRLALRRLPIAASGLLVAAGLIMLAIQPPWPAIVVGYSLFSAGLMAFLSVDSAMVAQMVGESAHRGKWLGIMNLTNTLPAIIVPALAFGAIQVMSGQGLISLIVSAAVAACCAAGLVMRVTSIR